MVSRSHIGARLHEPTRARRACPRLGADDLRDERGLQDPRHTTLDRLLRACGQELDLVLTAGEGVDATQFIAGLRRSAQARVDSAVEGSKSLEGMVRSMTWKSRGGLQDLVEVENLGKLREVREAHGLYRVTDRIERVSRSEALVNRRGKSAG